MKLYSDAVLWRRIARRVGRLEGMRCGLTSDDYLCNAVAALPVYTCQKHRMKKQLMRFLPDSLVGYKYKRGMLFWDCGWWMAAGSDRKVRYNEMVSLRVMAALLLAAMSS